MANYDPIDIKKISVARLANLRNQNNVAASGSNTAGGGTNNTGTTQSTAPVQSTAPAQNTAPVQSPDTTQGHVTAYDPNVNYKDLMDQAYREGRYSDAAYYEQLRNQKIDDLNAAGGGTNQYGATKSNEYSQYLGSGYTSMNASINGNAELHYEAVDQLKEYLQQNPSAAAQLSEADLRKLAEQYGIDPQLLGSFSQQGGYTQDRNTALAGGGTGQPVEGFYEDGTWYYYPGTDRPVKEGTSGADERFLSDGAYALVQSLSAEWFRLDALATAAKNAGNTELYNQYIADRNQCNITANQIRNMAGYSGGVDGSMYIPNGQLGIADPFRGGNDHVSSRVPVSDPSITLPSGGTTLPPDGLPPGGFGGNNPPGGNDDNSGNSGGGITPGGNNDDSGNSGGDITPGGNNGGSSGTIQTQSNLKDLLDAWKQAAMSQRNGKVDYAVAKAVADLERALQDAQPMFKEQAESIDLNARQAMDNSALYAEMRGDKGGIGQEQYNSIQNAAAQNHLVVQQAQTKLATDTERQIADLRAQGEFEKADAALEITQTYLAQLMSLEQWAAQYNLSVDQFNEQIRRWELEYQLALQQFAVDKDLAYGQLTGTIPSTGQSTLAMNQFLEQMREWEKEFGLAQDQFKVDTDLAYGQLTGTLPSTGQSTLANQQFQAGLQQWEQEFGFQQQQYQNALSQWEKEFAFQQQQYQNSLNQWQQQFDYGKQSDMANIALSLLQAGVALDANQLKALGISAEQASSLLLQAQMKEMSNSGSGKGDNSSNDTVIMDYAGLFEAAQESGHPQSFISNNYKKYGFTSSTGLYNDYKVWAEEASNSEPTLQDLDIGSVLDLNMGSLSYDEVELMVQYGALEMDPSGDKIAVRWANGWNAAKWREFKSRLSSPGGLLGFPGLT